MTQRGPTGGPSVDTSAKNRHQILHPSLRSAALGALIALLPPPLKNQRALSALKIHRYFCPPSVVAIHHSVPVPVVQPEYTLGTRKRTPVNRPLESSKDLSCTRYNSNHGFDTRSFHYHVTGATSTINTREPMDSARQDLNPNHRLPSNAFPKCPRLPLKGRAR